MRIEHKKVVKVDEVAELIPFKSGATFNQLWQIFYYTRLFKYVHRRHYIRIKHSYNKISTAKNLKKLCELGYLKSPQKDIYCATNKVLPIIKEVDEFPVEILPNEPVGKGSINEINNTEVFIKLLKRYKYHTLLYCNFGYLIPDALMILLDKPTNRYKLIFLEIEAQKPDWENYILKKRDNYLKLAKDLEFYNYWSKMCHLLELPKPKINELCFSVLFIGKIKKDFGKGFSFIEII